MAQRSQRYAPVIASLLVAGLFLTGSKPDPRRIVPEGRPASAATSDGWLPSNEWILAGNYAETCSDPPLCPGLFGAASESGTCRKVMVFQVTSGRFRHTGLNGLSAAAVLVSPDGGALSPDTRGDWQLARLYISDEADSAQAAGFATILGAMLSGPGGPAFTSVERVRLSVGFSAVRMMADIPGVLRVYLHPGRSLNKVRPPDLNNLGTSFGFLGPLYVYEADTLFVRTADTDWTFHKRSAVVSQFAWNSEVAWEESGEAVKP